MMIAICISGYWKVIQLKKIKLQFMNEYKRRVRIILESKLNNKNKMKAINTWAVEILRHGTGVLKWNVDEIRELVRKSRKLEITYYA